LCGGSVGGILLGEDVPDVMGLLSTFMFGMDLLVIVKTYQIGAGEIAQW
jgi:hypothetical protein